METNDFFENTWTVVDSKNTDLKLLIVMPTIGSFILYFYFLFFRIFLYQNFYNF